VPARITVLIGAYNAADYLGAALASVRDQVLDDIEVVVVNAGSTDATGALAEYAAGLDHRLRVLHAPHRLHIPGAKNFGLPAVRTPVVATLDADDLMTPTRLVDHLAALDADPALVAVCGTMAYIDAAGLPWRTSELPPTPATLRFELAFGCPALGSATTYRVDALHRLGGFHDASPWADDYPLLWRLFTLGDVGVVPHPACRYRWHPAQTTQVRRMPQFLDTVLLRRRIAASVMGRPPALGSALAWRSPGAVDDPAMTETAMTETAIDDLDAYVAAFTAAHVLDDAERAWIGAAHTRRRRALLDGTGAGGRDDADPADPAVAGP